MAPKFSDDRLSGFLDGVLPAEESAELRREISRDPELKQLVEELRQARGEVQALPRMRLGADFTARVMAAVELAPPPAKVAAPMPAVKVTAPPKPWKAFALGVLAASLVAIGVFVFVPPAKGPAVAEDPNKAHHVDVAPEAPVVAGVISLDELQTALADANRRPGQLFTARVTLKTADLKSGELDRLLAAHGFVVSPAAQAPQVATAVAKVWDELAADKQVGLTDTLDGVREVLYVEATAPAADAAVASLAKSEAVQIARNVGRLPASPETLLAATSFQNPNHGEGEATNTVGKSASGAAVRLGRKHIFKELGREDTAPAATETADVLLMIRVK